MPGINTVKFVEYLNSRYNLGLADKDITSITMSLRDAGFSTNLINEKDLSFVKDLVINSLSKNVKRYDPLKVSASIKVKSNFRSCPICNVLMEEVTLTNDSSAYYCKTHKVTLPKVSYELEVLRNF